ncbi:MAG TPA: DUF433 domain-containing protein [Polyangiaceae bacterium]|nr:DUF433 domain-containing protein [Polyangiaceae bacterium]
MGPTSRITVDPKVCTGQPCIRGLRIPVAIVLRHLAAGETAAQIVAAYPELEPEDVRACLQYAAWLATGRTLEVPPAA